MRRDSIEVDLSQITYHALRLTLYPIAVNLRSELLNCHALQRVDLKLLPPQKRLLSPRGYKTVG